MKIDFMLNFGSILIFSENPKELADFYKKVFEKDPDWSEQDYYGFMVGKGVITIGPHDKVRGKNTNPERLMVNLDTDDVKGEYERIKGLGAQVISEPYNPSEAPDTWIATFADVDGNFFQLTSPWEGGQ